eukprot:CAMPEP_0202690846 /NCGR_PEP_ID=MMETSP1385-20130828/5733_1 /ASSEMBLY_ACC=CAM_ASM_000861 /TAXON_ID=933848 /ORGANISM="Elphidium margaritaceum" /LENGTH=654 /DNA_ID=CAMNT_0049346161 /DNA_START=1369 /DNA_END=3333 /DNA_ORIENTATION=+
MTTPSSSTTAEGVTTPSDQLSAWLIHFGLSKYESSLRDAGLETFALVQSLDDEDIESIAEDINIAKLHKKILLKAVKAVKEKKYPAKAPPAISATEELKHAEDVELTNLRQSRLSLKGYVERFQDVETDMDGRKTRTVIFIGQTGAGKTTLINSMCSYLHRVAYNEPFRYQLIAEAKNQKISKDSTKSQTQDITKYHLRELPAVNHALNIIDTPGFGDTEGPEQDLKIRTKFKDFFTEIPYIDAVYFVVKASDTRLGATQKYIFNMVLYLFGHNVKDNIFVLFTFSDGAKPPALKAVDKLGVPYAGYFQINNSGFGLPKPEEANPTHKMFFDLGCKQFEIIFVALSRVQTISTQLTVDTLQERDNITTWLFKIGQDVKTALDQINEMHQTYQYLEANKHKINANKDFKIPDTKVEIREDPVSHYTTYCPICVETCHKNCGIPNDADKRGCASMRDGICTVCTSKCEWFHHINYPFTIRRETVTVWRTKQEMADKYHMAQGEAAKCEDIMKRLLSAINETEANIRDTIVKMKESVNRLQEIALNKNVLTDDQYFDTLIAAEKDEGRRGWEERVRQLESMKKDNKLLRDVTEGKEPISWKKNDQFLKYQQEFEQKQNATVNANQSDAEDESTKFSVGVGSYKVDVKFSKKSNKSKK